MRFASQIAVAALASALLSGPLDAQMWSRNVPHGTPPAARWGHSAIFNANSNDVIVFGGRGSGADADHVFNDLWALNVTKIGYTVWTQLAPSGTPPPPRWLHAALFDQSSDTMIIFGGMGGASGPCLNDVWLLHNASNKSARPAWEQLHPATGPGPRAAAAYGFGYANNSWAILVAGGTDCAGWPYDDAWMLSGQTGKWSALATGAANFPTGFHLGGPSMFMFPKADTLFVWGAPPATPPADKMVALVGAFTETPSWTTADVAGRPQSQPAIGSAVVYNPAIDRAVVFGGTSGSTDLVSTLNATDRTWRIDHASAFASQKPSWSELTAPGAPTARTGHTAVLDLSTDRMWIYGGAATVNGTTTVYGDTWVLYGATTDDTGVKLQLSPASLSFGSVTVGSISDPKTVTVTNGGTGVIEFNGITASGDFAVDRSNCIALEPSASCTFGVTFKPQSPGAVTGTVTIASADAPALTVSLSGSGICPFGGTTVCAQLSATFSINGDASSAVVYVLRGAPVSFAASTQIAESYFWNFGDGTLAPWGKSTTYTYKANGQYTVTLKVGANGTSATESRTVIVSDTPPPPRRRAATH